MSFRLLVVGFYSSLLIKSSFIFGFCTTLIWAEFRLFQRHIVLPFEGLVGVGGAWFIRHARE